MTAPIPAPRAMPEAAQAAWQGQVDQIEQALARLDDAVASGDTQAVLEGAQALQQALSQGVQATRHTVGLALPSALLQRLHWAQQRVSSHQNAVTRGRVAAERALSVLLVLDDANDGTYQAPSPGLGSRVASAYR